MSYAQIISAYRGSEKVDVWRNAEGQSIYYTRHPDHQQKTKLALEKARALCLAIAGMREGGNLF